MGVSLIEQVKIQAQVLVPLVRTLQAELGEERANALVRKSLGPVYRQFGDAWWRAQGASTFGEKLGKSFEAYAAGDALDYEVVKETDAIMQGADHCDFRYRLKHPPEEGS